MSSTPFDPAPYRKSGSDLNLSPAQLDQTIMSLRLAFQRIIDASFGDDPVQLAVEKRTKNRGRTDTERGSLAQQSDNPLSVPSPGANGRGKMDSQEP